MTSETTETATRSIGPQDERRTALPHLFFVNGMLLAGKGDMHEHVARLSRREVSL